MRGLSGAILTLLDMILTQARRITQSDAGATATEVAFKLAAQYWYNVGRPEKNEFVGFSEAYHGDTVGAMLSHFKVTVLAASTFPATSAINRET